MEIQCPQCQRSLTIADEYAGQLMQCPMCQGQFQAPALAPTPDPATSPIQPETPSFEPADDPYAAGSPPTASGNETSTVEEQSYQPPQQPQIQLPPGEYSKHWSIGISLKVVRFLPIVLLSMVFLLSFFPWFSFTFFQESRSANLWSLSFGESTEGPIMLFSIFAVFLAWPASIASFLVALNVIPLTGGTANLRPWRSVVVAGLLTVGVIFFSITYAKVIFEDVYRGGATLFLRMAYRLCWLALISLLLEFWLEWRRKSNLPPPKIDVHF